MTNLNIRSNSLGPEGGKAFAEMLKVNTALTKLDVRYNDIGGKGKQELRESVKGREGFDLIV